MTTFTAIVLYFVAMACAYMAGIAAQARDMQTSGFAVVLVCVFFGLATAIAVWG